MYGRGWWGEDARGPGGDRMTWAHAEEREGGLAAGGVAGMRDDGPGQVGDAAGACSSRRKFRLASTSHGRPAAAAGMPSHR